MKTKATRKMQTKGVRPRPDQIAALERLMETDPELDWSTAVRRGLDLFLAERMRAGLPARVEEVVSTLEGPSARPSGAAQRAARLLAAVTAPHSAEHPTRS